MPKYRRSRCFEFMLGCRTEYDRLVSADVQPPGFVIGRYKRQFKTVVHKPEVVNVGLEEVHVAHGEAPPQVSPGVEGLPIVRAQPHHPSHRRHRARRASTVLQDTIIDPGKAMQSGLTSQPSEVEIRVVAPPASPTFTSGISTPFGTGTRGLMDNQVSIPEEH